MTPQERQQKLETLRVMDMLTQGRIFGLRG